MSNPSYGKLHSGGSGAVNNANAEEFHRKQAALQDKMQPGYLLDRQKDIAELRKDAAGNNAGFPLGAQMAGKWVSQDREEDDRMAAFLQLPHNDVALGQKIMPAADLIDYAYGKLKKAQKVQWLQLARQMIDDRDPRSQEEAAAIVPELEKTPREFLKQNVGMQMALWEMLWAGRIRGEQDLDFLFAILRDDIEIPLAPLWDPIGIFSSILTGENGPLKVGNGTLPGDKRPSIFSTFLFGFNATEDGGDERTMRFKVKIAICKRVLPNLRNRTDDQVKDFILSIMARDNDFFAEKRIFRDGPGAGKNIASALNYSTRPVGAEDGFFRR